jgi:hypothetical protein
LELSASGFYPAPKLSRAHRFLEHLARRVVIQRLVKSFIAVEVESSERRTPDAEDDKLNKSFFR